MSIPPDGLAERLDVLERKHRRLQRWSLVSMVFVLLMGGWMLYSNNVYDGRAAETDAAGLHLWSDAHLSFPDKQAVCRTDPRC
ncbi:MAG: hypothetical protein GVY18_06915 [Bacteroidetes bacterium]|jgi:hypothetical protein|nr:hypothetical protein [Bacteroidota bacterium]